MTVLSGPGCQVLYGSEMTGGEETEYKDHLILANISQNGKPQAGDVLLSSFLISTSYRAPNKGSFSLTVRQRGRIL